MCELSITDILNGYYNVFQSAKIPEGKEIGLYTYEFNDFPMSEMDTCASVISMFSESGILNKFKIPYDVSIEICTV